MITVELPIRIRPVTALDVTAIREVIASTALFSPDLLDGMLAGYLAGHADGEQWLAVHDGGGGGQLVAVSYAAPERMTSGTWNLYLIAVRADRQGRRIGARLVEFVEADLAGRGARVLLVETSGLPEFARTRRFYRMNGYTEEARIREFYAAGDDKVVFWKALAGRVA